VSPAAINVLMPLSVEKGGIAPFLKDTAQNAQTCNITLLASGARQLTDMRVAY